jgi:hypothetical protein
MSPGRILAGAALVLCALGLTACAGLDQQGTPTQQISAWVKGTDFGETVPTLRADGARVATLLRRNSGSGAIHAACGVLLNDAQQANSNLPTPDEQLSQDLAQAYNLEQQAANECYDAGAANPALMAKARNKWERAGVILLAALDRADQLTGRAIPTTTTTEAGGGGLF